MLIERAGGTPTVTKDGVTVAHEIEIGNPFQNIGAQLAKAVASQSSNGTLRMPEGMNAMM